MNEIVAFATSSEVVAGVFGFALGMAVSARSKRRNRFDARPPYKPGAIAPKLDGEMIVLNPSKLSSSYNLMISTVTPRPIALVSSRSSKSKVDNVAPFSYFGAVGHDPPMISIGFCRSNGDLKDSISNILETKEFCVNIMSEWYLDAANHSCGNFPSNVDEFAVSGLIKAKDCEVVHAPRVANAAVSYECQLEYVHKVTNNDGKPTTEIVLARIVRVHVNKDMLVADCDMMKPAVDTVKLRPVGRLGGNIYTSLGDIVDIPRPKV